MTLTKIIKICSVHGELTIEQCNIGVYRGKQYKKCKLCHRESAAKFRELNREKELARHNKYYADNKDAIQQRRMQPERLAKRRQTYAENNQYYNRKCKEKQKKYREELAPSYIRKIIRGKDKNIKFNSIPQSLVDFKLTLIKLKKAVKKKNIIKRKEKANYDY